MPLKLATKVILGFGGRKEPFTCGNPFVNVMPSTVPK